MAAVTAERLLDIDNPTQKVMFPVASGATIYGGAAGVIVKEGYLENLSTGANVQEARMVVWISDKTANVDNTPTATTAAGSISGTLKQSSGVSGDKTCRECYTGGYVWCTFTAIAQSDVGKTVYLQNNNTADETAIDGIKVGTLDTYVSATLGRVELNKFYQKDGLVISRGSITAATTTAGGDCISWANPAGETILVEDVVLDITTQATGAANAEVGVAANGTTSSSTLMNTIDIGSAAAVFSATNDGGVAGQSYRKMTTSQYITMTPSATAAGLVGTYMIKYRIWE
jgi:hypothetical protein